MVRLPMNVAGVDGQLELRKDRIVISRKGFWAMLAHGLKPVKEVPLSAISSVEFQEAGRFSAGSISFLFTGSSTKAGDTMVKFQYAANESFKQLKEEIFQLMNTK